jgi:hypothetical protein
LSAGVDGKSTFTNLWFRRRGIEIKMALMSKKTEMSSSSLWIATLVLLALTAWMYFKK